MNVLHLDSPFSRPRNPDAVLVELRGQCPRLTVDVLDAVARARGTNRNEIVNDILSKWADQQLTEASLIARVTRGNPELSEVLRSNLEAIGA